MQLTKGDKIFADQIVVGDYLGKVELYEKEFHKVYDGPKKLNVYIPVEDVDKLKKIPGKETVKKELNSLLNNDDFIDVDELEGSRYKYFKAKLENCTFKKGVEVFHDLSLLLKRKEISSTERKLHTGLKEKLVDQISYVLKMDKEELTEKLS